MSELRGVAAPIFRQSVRHVVDVLEHQAGLYIRYDEARDVLAQSMGLPGWSELMKLDLPSVARRRDRLGGESAQRRLQQILLSRYGIQLSDRDLFDVTRCEVSHPHAKPADFVVPVATTTGTNAGLFVSAIGRDEHQRGISELYELIGSREGLDQSKRRLVGNTLIPSRSVFYQWTSKSVGLEGIPRALFVLQRAGLDITGTRTQLDELLDWWGFVPYIQFYNGDERLTSQWQSMHATWSRSHLRIGASGQDAVSKLAFLAQAFDNHDFTLLFASPPSDIKSWPGRGVYVLSSQASGPINFNNTSSSLHVVGDVPHPYDVERLEDDVDDD